MARHSSTVLYLPYLFDSLWLMYSTGRSTPPTCWDKMVPKWYPRYRTSLRPTAHFPGLAVSPACLRDSSTASTRCTCSAQVVLWMIASSKYMQREDAYTSMRRWKVAGAPNNPKGSWYNPYRVGCLGVFPDPMWGSGTGMSICTDCKALWDKLVICENGLYN